MCDLSWWAFFINIYIYAYIIAQSNRFDSSNSKVLLYKNVGKSFKTMRGDSLKRHHMLKRENVRMEDMKNVEEKECLKQGLSDEQKYEMMKKGGIYINMENKNTFKMKVNEKYKNIKRGIKEVFHIEIMDNEIEIVIFK